MLKNSSKHIGHCRMKFRKSSSFVRVIHAMKQLQKGFLYFFSWEARNCYSAGKVDKEGHFSVLATGNGEPKKFLVALSYLAYPPFIKLLEAAEQEYGFNQKGVLVVPCEGSELQRILLRKQIGDD
uniref:Uncharacterized protein n=1 Tax=Davidia involucrata TaxID=16924 RepID=A0A5B7C8L9_DAVIN